MPVVSLKGSLEIAGDRCDDCNQVALSFDRPRLKLRESCGSR